MNNKTISENFVNFEDAMKEVNLNQALNNGWLFFNMDREARYYFPSYLPDGFAIKSLSEIQGKQLYKLDSNLYVLENSIVPEYAQIHVYGDVWVHGNLILNICAGFYIKGTLNVTGSIVFSGASSSIHVKNLNVNELILIAEDVKNDNGIIRPGQLIVSQDLFVGQQQGLLVKKERYSVGGNITFGNGNWLI